MSKSVDFIIIGAMKCATSSLHTQLSLQPGIFMSEPKEPNFFSNDEIYAQGMEWYLSLFADAKSGDICGESSTHYTKLPTYPKTIERIKQNVGSPKMIYVMRHPIQRLVSQYIHEWSQAVIPKKMNINEAIYKFPELIEYSLYTQQLQPFFDAFGQENILPIFFERMIKSPQEELERVAKFIGYSDQVAWNHELEADNVSAQRMRKNAVRDFFVEAPVLKQARQVLIPKEFRNWVKNLWTMKQRPQLEEQQIEYLTKIFDEDLKKLGEWLNVELNCENYKQVVMPQSLSWVGLPGAILK